MNTAPSNPARAWPTCWGKEAVKWCEDQLFNAKVNRKEFADKQTFMRFCMSETNGMLNPKVPADVWDESQVKEAA